MSNLINKVDLNVEWEAGKNHFGTVKKKPANLGYVKIGMKAGSFVSPFEFFKSLESNMKNPKNGKSSAEKGKGEFHSFDSYEEAWETFVNEPGSLDSKDRLAAMLTSKEETGQTIENGVTGDFLDMGLFMEGDPECFGSLTFGHPRRFRIDMTIDLNAAWFVDEAQMNRKLQRVIRLVDWAAKNNVAMRIKGVTSTQCAHAEVTIKEYDERLNLNNLIVTAHSEFFRRMCFRFMEYSDTWEYGYGTAYLYSAEAKKMKRESVETMYISVYNGRDMKESTTAKAFDELEKMIQEHVQHANAPFVEQHVLVDKG